MVFFLPLPLAYDLTLLLFVSSVQHTLQASGLSNLNDSTISGIDLVLCCSDHSSHFTYAKHFLCSGIDVYCEKPLTTSLSQLYELATSVSSSSGRFFAGYNRPHSPFVKKLRETFFSTKSTKLFLDFNVSGHFLTSDHWYRSSGQGSRIYGNLGHWIDLFVHACFWLPVLPVELKISAFYFDSTHTDENIMIHISDGQSVCLYFLFLSC